MDERIVHRARNEIGDLSKALARFVPLLAKFVRREISADEFEAAFTHDYLSNEVQWSREVFDVIDYFFAEVDAYVSDPGLRDSPEDLGPDELRKRARALLIRAGIDVDGTNESGPGSA